MEPSPSKLPSERSEPKVERVEGGLVIQGTFPDRAVLDIIKSEAGPLVLTIADPPYGNVVSDAWDKIDEDAHEFANWMTNWTNQISMISAESSALYVWGGIGRPGFRPFYSYAAEIEQASEYTIANHITWSKKRAYGIQHNYLFTREELLYLCKGEPKKPRLFKVPYLAEKRGYPGFNKDFPAKSEYKRRTNVWSDVTELLRGKIHTAQKPDELHRIIIEAHTEPGEYVLDPFAGSGTTGRAARQTGRKFILVERDPASFELILANLDKSF